jgi:plastocyanin
MRNLLLLCAVSLVPVFAAEHVVLQKDRTFSETELTIKPGDKIVFKNADEVTHNVFSSTKGMEFDIKRQEPGEATPITFDKEGTLEVRCAIHPRMKLMVNVKR